MEALQLLLWPDKDLIWSRHTQQLQRRGLARSHACMPACLIGPSLTALFQLHSQSHPDPLDLLNTGPHSLLLIRGSRELV